jgi:hypothetical protein
MQVKKDSNWILETDLYSSSLRFSIYLKDIKINSVESIPGEDIRMIKLRDPRQQLEMVELLPGIQFSHFYTGVMMDHGAQERDFQNQTENSIFSSNNSIFYGNDLIDDLNHFPLAEYAGPAKHSRGRRVSSLGDEVYYVTYKTGTERKDETGKQHQHSLESFQLQQNRIIPFM